MLLSINHFDGTSLPAVVIISIVLHGLNTTIYVVTSEHPTITLTFRQARTNRLSVHINVKDIRRRTDGDFSTSENKLLIFLL